MTTHASLSNELVRPPGCPPSHCHGELRRVDGSGGWLADGAPETPDDAQPGEGPPGSLVPVALYRCSRCRATLVVSECRDAGGNIYRRLRNDYAGPIPDGAACPAAIS